MTIEDTEFENKTLIYVIEMLKELDRCYKDAKRVGYINTDNLTRIKAAYTSVRTHLAGKGFITSKQQRFLLDLILRFQSARWHYDNPKTEPEYYTVQLPKTITHAEIFAERNPYKAKPKMGILS